MENNRSRQTLLEQDLIHYNPQRWKINIPFKSYTIRVEDLVPAISGVIGKISLVAAFAVAWAGGLGITDPSFVTENVRLEIVLAGILAILFSGVLNPHAGPPGTLAPLIPLVPVMITSGVHPLPLSILIGAIGLALSAFRYFDKLVLLSGEGTKAGILLLFGFLGINSALHSLKSWTEQTQGQELYLILLTAGLGLYILLTKYKLRWCIIPACAAAAIGLSALFGHYPTIQTGMGLPIMNPDVWWNQKWGIGWGLTLDNFLRALPFALLSVVMWPIDALAIKTIQETHYPKEAEKAVFCMNSTYMVVSVRNILGAFLGGSQIAAVWRSFMIPLGIVKRPIGASALLLGLLAAAFGVLGFPIDVAVFPPLLWSVLIFGVFVPLVEVGLNTIKSTRSAQAAVVCILAGLAANPVLGWLAALATERLIGLQSKKEGGFSNGQSSNIHGNPASR